MSIIAASIVYRRHRTKRRGVRRDSFDDQETLLDDIDNDGSGNNVADGL